MGGYTPAFGSIYDGTLFGKWPTAVVWASLLPLIDAKGEINLSYEAIAGRTGWPMDLLRAGIHELMQPDPGSRSDAEEGRRLVLLDPSRPWGWRAVNTRKYRDMASGSDQVADGRNAAKVRRYKARKKTPTDTDGHRGTPSNTTNTHSDSNTDSDKKKNSEVSDTSSGGVGGDASRKRAAEQRGSRIPTPFLVTAEMRKWASEKTPHVNLEAATEDFCNYWRALPGQRSRKLDWVLTWKNRMKECEDKAMRRGANGKPKEGIDEIMARQRREAEAEGEPL